MSTAIDPSALLQTATAAFMGQLGPAQSKIKNVGLAEMRKLAQTIAAIQAGILTGEITPDTGKAMLEAQKNTAASIVALVAELELAAVQAAINAAMAAIKDTVNTALNFPLIA
jgi:hypothetical protein